MADVGVLNLQIHDDSSKAAEGLGRLATKLESVKKAAQGLNLGNLAKQISNIGKAVEEQVHGSTFSKLTQLAEALKQIKDVAGGIGNIKISFGGSGSGSRGGSDISGKMRTVRDSVSQVKFELEQVEQKIQESSSRMEGMAGAAEKLNAIIQNVGWTAQATAEQFQQMYEMMNSMRMSRSLGEGTSPLALGDGTGGSGAAWTYWKDGAIEVEGTVDDVSSSVRRLNEAVSIIPYNASDVAEPFEQMSEAVDEVTDGLEKATAAAQAYSEAIGATGEWNGLNASEVKQLNDAVEFARQWNASGVQQSGYQGQEASDIEYANNLIDTATKADLLGMRIDALRDKLYQMVGSGKFTGDQIARMVGQIQSLQANLDGLNSAGSAASGIDEVAGATDEMADKASRGQAALQFLRNAFENVSNATKSLLSPLTGIISSLGRVARYRMLRAVIKQVTEGIKEGTENYYRYSNAIGSSFAPAMDSVSSSLSQMKNSIGAAAAPAISAVIPILNSIISLAITAINYLNQLIALLRGQSTWSRATTQSAKAFDDVADSAGGAGSAVKDLLADWDELNIIQSESGGGGGGGASAMSDWLNMFEEVSEFNKTIQDIVDGINDQFGSVLNLIERIGAAILAWKLSTALTGGLATLASLAAAGLIIGLVFDITTMLDKKYFETGEIGWLVADVITTAIGSYLAGKVVSKVLGTGAGYVAASITLGVSALADIIALAGATDVSALSEESILTSIKAALKLGTGMFLIGKAAGMTAATSAGLGIAAAAIGIGVALGIKATASTIDTGEITRENVVAMVASAAAVALGVTAAALMTGTAVLPAVGAGLAAGGAMLLGFSVVIGVAALINMAKEDIKWGDVVLTDEDVQNFVGTKLVTVDINVASQLIAKNVEVTNTQKSAIATKITQALGTFKVIQLGLADKEDYSELNEQINGEGGLVSQIQGYIDAAKEAGKLTLEFTPSLVGSTEGDQTSWFKNYSSGWDTVNQFAETTGKEIGKYLVKGEKEQLSQGESEILAELMGQMSRLSSAISKAQIKSDALSNLQFSMGDLSQKSVDDISKAFSDYRTELTTQYQQLEMQAISAQESLAAALFVIDPNGEEYKKAMATLAEMRANMIDSVNSEVEAALLPGKEWFAQLLTEKYGQKISAASDMLKQGMLDDFLDFGNMDLGSTEKEMAANINDILLQAFGTVNSDLERYMRAAGLDAWSLMTDEMKAAIRSHLEQAFGDSELAQHIIDLWEHNSPVEEIVEETRQDFEGMPDVQAENSVELTTTVTENTEFVEGETTGELTDMTGATGGLVDSSPVQQATSDVKELAQTTQETATTINAIKLDALNFDTSQAESAANSAAATFESMASRIRSAILSLRGLAYSFSGGMWGGSFAVTIPAAAEGGIFHSGDVFSANENGSAELIGRYGNNTAVANNEQIVTGITRGVAQGNDSVVSALQTLVTVAQQIQRKEFTAKVVPSSGVGRNNQQSADAYSLITG